MKKVFYRVRGWNDGPRSVEVYDWVDIRRYRDALALAELCAEDFHWSKRPAADAWPLGILLMEIDGGETVSSWEVNTYVGPQFWAEPLGD